MAASPEPRAGSPEPRAGSPEPRIGVAPPPAGRFGRGDRLQHQSDFRRAMKKGRKYQGPHVLLVALRGATDHSRLGLAVAKTVGHSPARARLRRLLREAFRGLRGQLKAPTDLVVLARLAWPDANLAAVSNELWQAAVQMRLVG